MTTKYFPWNLTVGRLNAAISISLAFCKTNCMHVWSTIPGTSDLHVHVGRLFLRHDFFLIAKMYTIKYNSMCKLTRTVVKMLNLTLKKYFLVQGGMKHYFHWDALLLLLQHELFFPVLRHANMSLYQKQTCQTDPRG